MPSTALPRDEVDFGPRHNSAGGNLKTPPPHHTIPLKTEVKIKFIQDELVRIVLKLADPQ